MAYYHNDNIVLSRKEYFDAFNSLEDVEDKLHFSHKIARLSADLGDKKTLNEHIKFIEEFEKFDDDHSVSAFENWKRNLQKICEYVVPDDFKEQPNTYFMYDEEDSDFMQIKDTLLEIKKLSKNVTERDEKLKNFLIQLSEKTSRQNNSFSLEKEISKLRSKIGESKSLREKAQLMYELGGLYFRQHDDNEAYIWFLKAMNAKGASENTIIWAKITHAQVLMNKSTKEDDEAATTFLNEVFGLIETSNKYEAKAFCQFNRGRLEARKGNFQCALRFFEQSNKAIMDGKIDNPALCEEIKKCYFSVNEYLHYENNPKESLPFLQSELLFLQTWYPEYAEQLTEYWWYYRGKEPLSNIRVSSTSACVIFSDDKNKICWYSEALRFIFAHCLFAPKESWDNINHAVIRTIPVPCNTPFPYSVFMVNDKKIEGKVYGYNIQIDGIKQTYAYKRLQDDESFDKYRDPNPITLSYMGYRFPEIVSQIAPMTDELGSCRWWIGLEFGGSPEALINLVSKFGVIPVFSMDDLNNSDKITVLRAERVDIPFTIYDNNWTQRKRIQKELRRMTAISDQVVMFSAFDNVVDQISALSQENITLVSVHLSIVRYGHYVWNESPIQWRTYPVVLVNSEDERRNNEIDDVISKGVAIRDAKYLMNRIYNYANHPHNLDELYIKEDALQLLKLSKYIGDKSIENFAAKVLTAL